jgi:hypothetical protein
MKRLIVIALLLCGPAQAQFTTMGVDNPPAGGPPFSGPADVVASPIAFWGLRAMSAAVASAGTQKLFNARRASDGQTCDFLVASSGGVGNSTACSGAFGSSSLGAFCGATTCTVVTFYDQSGHGQDFSQGTTANQPTITLDCSTTSAITKALPCATSTGAAELDRNPFSTQAQPFTVVSTVACSGPCPSANGTFLALDGFNVQFLFGATAGTTSLYAGTVTTGITASVTNGHSLIGIYSGASSLIVVEGAASSALTAGTNPTGGGGGPSSIMANSGSPTANPFHGSLMEMGVWAGAFNATQYGNMSHNQCAYWGTPTAC